MAFFHLLILSIVQGITEFLPISSSGHLALVPILTHWQDQGLKLDIATHVGSLFAVLIYFRSDIFFKDSFSTENISLIKLIPIE